MSDLSQFLAQAIGPVISENLYTSGATLTVDDEVFALVAIGGGGGSGAKSINSSTRVCLATGGNAGGTVIKMIRMVPGVNYTLTLGAGGASVANTTNVQDGNDGVNSTFVSSDSKHSITAYGGLGGKRVSSAPADTTYARAADTALSGIGGHYHFDGGQGGDLSAYGQSGCQCRAATGGGAVNFIGPDAVVSGGEVSVTSAVTSFFLTTGGGGVGGRGGSITGTVSTDTVATGGGGTDSLGVVTGVDVLNSSGDSSTAGGDGRTTVGDNGIGLYMQPAGAGGAGSITTADAGDGEAGGGGGSMSVAGAYYGGDGGIFAGGGAQSKSVSTNNAGAGNGGLGAGGGGLTGASADAGNPTGAGGGGWCIVRQFVISRNIR